MRGGQEERSGWVEEEKESVASDAYQHISGRPVTTSDKERRPVIQFNNSPDFAWINPFWTLFPNQNRSQYSLIVQSLRTSHRDRNNWAISGRMAENGTAEKGRERKKERKTGSERKRDRQRWETRKWTVLLCRCEALKTVTFVLMHFCLLNSSEHIMQIAVKVNWTQLWLTHNMQMFSSAK